MEARQQLVRFDRLFQLPETKAPVPLQDSPREQSMLRPSQRSTQLLAIHWRRRAHALCVQS